MTDSSKKPTSKTQGVGFQKTDDQAESTSSKSSASEQPAETKKPEPEVPTESIFVSPVTPEPVQAEVPEPPKPPEPEPVQAEVPEPPKPPEPKLEPVSATQPAVFLTPEPINVIKPPAEIKMEPQITPTVPVTVNEVTTVESSQLNVQAIKDRVLHVISDLPENFSNFFGEYQRPLWTLVGIVLIIVTAKALIGVLDSINDIPLVQLTLELVGVGYSGWFVYRYLLRSENRQELLAKFQSLKEEVIGKDS